MRKIETAADIEEGLTVLAALDPRLSAVIKTAGPLPLRLREATMQNLMRIVVSQQLSVESAAAIWGRVEQAFDTHKPVAIIQADEDALRACGLSRPKIKTLRAIASAAQDKQLDFKTLIEKPTTEVNESLTKIHGVGPWTAEIFSLFCLGNPDIFPVGDIALQKGVEIALNLKERPKGEVLEAIALQWSPWRGVAARLFWAYYGAVHKKKSALPT